MGSKIYTQFLTDSKTFSTHSAALDDKRMAGYCFVGFGTHRNTPVVKSQPFTIIITASKLNNHETERFKNWKKMKMNLCCRKKNGKRRKQSSEIWSDSSQTGCRSDWIFDVGTGSIHYR